MWSKDAVHGGKVDWWTGVGDGRDGRRGLVLRVRAASFAQTICQGQVATIVGTPGDDILPGSGTT